MGIGGMTIAWYYTYDELERREEEFQGFQINRSGKPQEVFSAIREP